MIFPFASLLNTRWLINKEAVYNMLPFLVAYINGREIDFSVLDDSASNKPYILSVSQNQQVNVSDTYDLQSNAVPENSVAIIPVQGVILPNKTMDMVNYIRMAESNPNVIAVLFLVNTPGGAVFFTDTAAGIIKNMSKPSVGYVMNMGASAGMWLLSAMNRIVLSSPLDRVGSIGVMTSMMDASKFLKEKLGIDIMDIYATASTNKNEQIRTFLNTDLPLEDRTKSIVADLDFVNVLFHEAIQKNLSISPDSEVFSGGVYDAGQAIQLGLAHEICSFEDALMLARRMGLKIAINRMFNSNTKLK